MAVIDTLGLVNVGSVKYKKKNEKDSLFIDTGIDGADDELNGLEGGRVTLVTGRPGEGKSTFVHRAALYAVSCGHPTLIVDGEHDQETLINNLYIKLIGYNDTLYDKIRYHRKIIKQPKKHIYMQLQEWSKHLWIYSKSVGQIKNLDNLFRLYREMTIQYGIRFIILDNLMTLLDHKGDDQNKAQADFMNKCHDFAIANNVHIVLVAHPNKSAVKGEAIDYYQISGASELINLADNVLQVVRVEGKEYDGFIEILKNRGYGTYKRVPLDFDKNTGALVEHGVQPRAIDWQRNGLQEKLKTLTGDPF